MLAPVPACVPGRKKPAAPVKHENGLGVEEVDSDAISPASFARHKSVLAAKLSNVGNKTRPVSKPSTENKNTLAPGSPEKVLVIPIHDSPSEMPGLASEESVLRKNFISGGGKEKMNYVGFDDSMSFRDGSLNSAGGEVLEKRTRFSISHDEGSIGNASDNLEAISEAASNHSVASSLEDEVDPVEDPIIDNLSDMVSANVSGRGTPNVSGRDTPSSQVTEEDEAGQAEVAEPQVPQVVNLIGEDQQDNNLLSRRKNGEPDMEERFGRFEIKPEVRRRVGHFGSTGTAGDRDEAVSMVSDTWSTDVLGSDTETLGDPPTLEDLLRGRPGDEFNNRGEFSNRAEFRNRPEFVNRGEFSNRAEFRNRPEFQNRNRNLDHLHVPNEGSLSHNNSSSAISTSGQLDVLETNSEAWSMDVLPSDTESFRMRDFDPDDSLSIASTRFTDDTTRSEPEQLIQRLELNDYDRAAGAEPGRIFHPAQNSAVEQWAQFSRSNSDDRGSRRDSDVSVNSSILKKPNALHVNLSEPSLVSLVESTTTDGCGSVENVSPGTGNLSTISTNVRLSTTSIASSTSSQGSAASVEAIHSQRKSRSNSSTSAANSTGGGLVPEELKSNQASTGAIPKSISFDKSADKDEGGEHKHSLNKRDRNFFKNWKLPKIGRHRGGGRGSKSEDYRSSDRLTNDAFHIPEHSEGPVLRRIGSEDPRFYEGGATESESSDDILAKYRTAPGSSKEGTLVNIIKPEDETDGVDLDLANLESTVVFQDAKRKLRLMLSEVKCFSRLGDCFIF